MYQFSEQLGGILQNNQPKTYRWRGLLAGIVLGWLPAWGLQHALHWRGWSIPLLWLGIVPLAYVLGSKIKKSR